MRSPMIAQMIQEMGLEIGEVIAPGPGLMMEDANKRSYNVFYVPEALNSPYIPAQQDFVARHNIRSVIGFGGLLPSKELFVVILFSKTAISARSSQFVQVHCAVRKRQPAPVRARNRFRSKDLKAGLWATSKTRN